MTDDSVTLYDDKTIVGTATVGVDQEATVRAMLDFIDEPFDPLSGVS